MHIPDGLITGATTTGFGLSSAAAMALAVRRSGAALVDRAIPLSGLVAVVVFALQMVHFPVLPGVNGHLFGSVLAAVLVGPWAAILIMATVFGTQALFFADGGVTALGLNTFNFGLVASGGGYLIFRLVHGASRRGGPGVAAAAGAAAAASVPLAAAFFVLQYSLGGSTGVSIAAVSRATLGAHAAIGVVEGLLTAAVVGVLMHRRPDLVHGSNGATQAPAPTVRALVSAGIAAFALLAVGAASFASAEPDGVAFVERLGRDSAGHGESFVGIDTSDVLAFALIGSGIVLVAATALIRLLRRGERGTPHAAAGGHVHALYRHGGSRLHRAPAHVKLVVGIGFAVGVAATPREAFWAFAVYTLALVAAGRAARLTPSYVVHRMVVAVPFITAAAVAPFFAGGEHVDVAGLTLSVPGLWASWNIVIKITLGIWTAVVLGSTSTTADLLTGLERLRLPPPIVGTVGFMLRHLDIALGRFARAGRAAETRGAPPVRSSIPAVLGSSLAQGERLYLAMASRGYTGSIPAGEDTAVTRGWWTAAAAILAATWTVTSLAWVLR